MSHWAIVLVPSLLPKQLEAFFFKLKAFLHKFFLDKHFKNSAGQTLCTNMALRASPRDWDEWTLYRLKAEKNIPFQYLSSSCITITKANIDLWMMTDPRTMCFFHSFCVPEKSYEEPRQVPRLTMKNLAQHVIVKCFRASSVFICSFNLFDMYLFKHLVNEGVT